MAGNKAIRRCEELSITILPASANLLYSQKYIKLGNEAFIMKNKKEVN